MRNMNTFNTAPIFALLISLAGCSESNANGADATAEAIVSAGFRQAAANEEMFAVFQQQPEYKHTVACYAQSLSDQGWTQEQHNQYMKATQGSGNLAMLNKNEYSESDAIAMFGPIAMATDACM